MNRRYFLLNFLLWILSFTFGYRVSNFILESVGTLNEQLVQTNQKVKGVTVDVVIDFGAKGDGITDDSIPFENAIDYVSNNGGGTVVIPPNIYVLEQNTGFDSAFLTPKSNVTSWLWGKL